MFTALKSIHLTTVVIAIGLFVLRGFWMLRESAWLQHPTMRIAPHINDSLLFFSALGMTPLIGQYPFVDGWLTAKFLAVIAYIILGHIALRRGPNRKLRGLALAAACATLAYIVGVALCRDPRTCLGA